MVNFRRSLEETPKPPINLKKADSTGLKPIPKKPSTPEPSFVSPDPPKQGQQKRGREGPERGRGREGPERGRGRGRGRGQNRSQSRDSRPENKRWRPDNNNNNNRNAQRRIDRSKERNVPVTGTSNDPGTFNPEFFRQLFTSVLNPPTTSAPVQVSDPRVRPSPTPPSATVTKATFIPSEHGDKVIRRPDGKIDWRYAPVQPSDLPPDRKFDADVRDGHWCVRISKK